MDGELLFLDSVAYQIKANEDDHGACIIKRAPGDAELPFVMVTKFVPEYGLNINGQLEMETLMDIFSAEGPDAGGKNSFIPFRIRGEFSCIQLKIVGPRDRRRSYSAIGFVEAAEQTLQRQLTNVKGTMFGFVSPQWADRISFPGAHCHFLSEKGEDGNWRGGHVKDFQSKGEMEVNWSVTGRFHLGLPRGERWEALDLVTDAP
jgi:alpha-acetolactate decarboxylase